MMEFDTDIKIRPFASGKVESGLELEPFCQKVWDVLKDRAKNIGQMSGTQFWLDFSEGLSTRYIICNIEPADGGYLVTFSYARKPGYIGDAVLAFAALGTLWGLVKVLDATAGPVHWAALGLGLVIAAALALVLSKPFWKTRIPALQDAVNNIF